MNENTFQNIQMVDLNSQYHRIKTEIDDAVLSCIASTQFINGQAVQQFEQELANYLGANHVIGCANGTDALQIAFMALMLEHGLQRGDEVIVPSFTYVATAEVLALLGLTPVMVDVDAHTFNITAEIVEKAITPRTKAVVPVHLFGQSCDMESIMAVANQHNLFVVEDNAQAIGAVYTFSDGTTHHTSTMGHIGTTSFFPSKNLGCYGDGGAVITNDDTLASRIRMIANHGQSKKYHHQVIGINSRLDTLQAAILRTKLPHLDSYYAARNRVADAYDAAFASSEWLQTPFRQANSTHAFHQYTLQIKDGKRNALKSYLQEKGIPSMIYYPIPLYQQHAFAPYWNDVSHIITEKLCDSVLSLPIHTEMQDVVLHYIIESVKQFA